MGLEPEGVRHRVELKLPEWLTSYGRAYAHSPNETALSEEACAAGLISGAEYARIFRETTQGTLVPWFAQRGITLDASVVL